MSYLFKFKVLDEINDRSKQQYTQSSFNIWVNVVFLKFHQHKQAYNPNEDKWKTFMHKIPLKSWLYQGFNYIICYIFEPDKGIIHHLHHKILVHVLTRFYHPKIQPKSRYIGIYMEINVIINDRGIENWYRRGISSFCSGYIHIGVRGLDG